MINEPGRERRSFDKQPVHTGEANRRARGSPSHMSRRCLARPLVGNSKPYAGFSPAYSPRRFKCAKIVGWRASRPASFGVVLAALTHALDGGLRVRPRAHL